MRIGKPVVVVVTVLGLSGCGGGGTTATQPGPSAVPSPPATTDATGSPTPTDTDAASPGPSATPASATDTADITKVVKAVDVTANFKGVVCDQLFTQAFVTEAFGTLTVCRQSQDGSQKGSNATSVSVAAVKIDGDSASATVTDHGGFQDGATGTWYFTRSAGAWRVSNLGVNYMRSNFKQSGAKDHGGGGADDPFANAAYRDCYSSTLLGLADGQFRTIFFGTSSGRSNIGTIVAVCNARAPGGVSPFRTAFNAQYKQALTKAKVPTTVQSCAVDANKSQISDADLTDDMLDAGVASSAGFTHLSALEQSAYQQCAGGSGSSTTSPSPSATSSPS